MHRLQPMHLMVDEVPFILYTPLRTSYRQPAMFT